MPRQTRRARLRHEDRLAPLFTGSRTASARFSGYQYMLRRSDPVLLPFTGAIRNCQALRVLSSERSDSSRSAYMRPIYACAMANSGSISAARLESGNAALAPLEERTFQAAL